MKTKRTAVFVAVVFAVAAAGTGAGLAVSANLRTNSPTIGAANNEAVPAAVTTQRKLKRNFISQDSGSLTVAAGFQPIDALTTVNCPSTSTTSACTIEAEQHVQVNGSTAGNNWAICTQVDGQYMAAPACPFLGAIPSDGSYTTGTFAQSKTGVSVGNHTVRTFLYTTNGATRDIYEITYRLYVP
jgi:hypothetical protein